MWVHTACHILSFPLGAWEQSTYVVKKNKEANVGHPISNGLRLPQYTLTERWWRGLKERAEIRKEGNIYRMQDKERKADGEKEEDGVVEKRRDGENVNPTASSLRLFLFSFEWLMKHRRLVNVNMFFRSLLLQMSMWPAYISQRLMHILQSWLMSRPSIWVWTRTGPLSQITIGMETT